MNMPPGQGGTLSDREYRDITGFILRANGQQAAGTIAIKSENVAPSSPSQPHDKKAETGSEKGIDRFGLDTEISRAASKALIRMAAMGNRTVEKHSPVTEELLPHPHRGDWVNWTQPRGTSGTSPTN